MTLLWVELNAHHIPSSERYCDIRAVPGGGDHIVLITAYGMVGVDKVEPLLSVFRRQEWVGSADFDRVPAHVRDFERGIRRQLEAAHHRLYPTEPWQNSFLTSRTHELHAQTDSKNRPMLLDRKLVKDWSPASFVERAHPMIESTDARQNDLLAVEHLLWSIQHGCGSSRACNDVQYRCEVPACDGWDADRH